MVKNLKVEDGRRCIGCLSCRQACARMLGEFSPAYSALDVKTSGGLSGDFIINVCRACEDPACREACKFEALALRTGGGVVFDREKCKKCGACAEACGVSVISFDREDYPIICKHCGYCTRYCPHNCIILGEVEQ